MPWESRLASRRRCHKPKINSSVPAGLEQSELAAWVCGKAPLLSQASDKEALVFVACSSGAALWLVFPALVS